MTNQFQMLQTIISVFVLKESRMKLNERMCVGSHIQYEAQTKRVHATEKHSSLAGAVGSNSPLTMHNVRRLIYGCRLDQQQIKADTDSSCPALTGSTPALTADLLL